MKDIWKEIVIVAALVILIGAACGLIGYMAGAEKIDIPQNYEASNSQKTIDV